MHSNDFITHIKLNVRKIGREVAKSILTLSSEHLRNASRLFVLIGLGILSLPMFATASLIAQGKHEIRAKHYTKGITFFSKAKHKALEENDYPNLFEAEMGYGICYSNVTDYGRAIIHFYKALQICKDKHLGWKSETRVNNALAGVYYDYGNLAHSYEMLRHCLKAAVQHADSTDATAYAVNIMRVSIKMKQPQTTLTYQDIVKRYALGSKEISQSVLRYMDATKLFLLKKYDSFIVEALPLLRDPLLPQSDKDELLLNVLSAYKTLGRTKEALSLAHSSLDSTPYDNSPEVYGWLAAEYKRLGNSSMALDMMDSVVRSITMKQQRYNKQQAENLRYRTEMMQEIIRIDKEVEAAKYRQNLYLLLICLCLLAVFVAVLFILMQRQRNRQRHKLLEMEIRETELQSKYQKNLMKMEMGRQSRELSAMTVFMTSRNSILNELLQKLHSIEGLGAVKEVNEIINNLRQMLKSGEERDHYITNFEAAHPGLLRRLKEKHPILTNSDLQFLTYVAMNLTNQDIASLMNITPESCKKRRTRISKKIGLETSADLYKYLIDL